MKIIEIERLNTIYCDVQSMIILEYHLDTLLAGEDRNEHIYIKDISEEYYDKYSECASIFKKITSEYEITNEEDCDDFWEMKEEIKRLIVKLNKEFNKIITKLNLFHYLILNSN